MPGITIGDIGKKMGRDGIDNGYIQVSQLARPSFDDTRLKADIVVHICPSPPGTHAHEAYTSISRG